MRTDTPSINQILQQTLDTLEDAFFLLDADYRFVYMNDAAHRMLPLEGDPMGKILWDVAPHLAGTPIEAQYREAFEHQHAVHLERYYADRDRWYEVHAYPTPNSLAIYFRDITERKKTETALRDSEERFRQLTDNIREVFYVIDPKTKQPSYMSPAFKEVYGFDYERGRFFDAVVDEDKQKLAAVRDSYEHGRPTQTEFRIRQPNGEIRWILDRSFPVCSDDGKLVNVVGIAEDVTAERRYQERALYMTEAAHILASTLDFQEILDRLTRLAVPTMADWCAVYLPQHVATLKIASVAHVDPKKVALAYDVERRFPTNPSNETGTYGVLRSGQPEYVRDITEDMIRHAPMEPEHREIILKLGLRSVITVPLQARGKNIGVMSFISAESNRLYNPDDVVFAQDLANRAAIAAANAHLYSETKRRATEERALREAAEAVAASFSVDDILKVIAQSALHATNADGSFVERIDGNAEFVHVVANAGEMAPQIGEKIPFEGSVAQKVLEKGTPMPYSFRSHAALAVPMIDAGEAIGALILLRHKNAIPFTDDECARAHTFGNLASLGFRKVHLLESSELRREELEQVMESRARLMRGFSHDLKNPIGAADGHAALLEDGLLGELTEQQKNSVKRIRHALGTAVQLINDLVELARAESGQLVIKEQPVDVREIARELVEQYRPAAQQAGLEISCDLKPVEVVSSDADRIRQIVGNLLSNAVKYTKTGGRVQVVTGLEDQSVKIDVVDTGIGIPEDKLGVLFREFQRIDPKVKPGIGLGLAISRRLAQALGGELSVRTERGTGSTFTLSLPR